MLGLELPWLDDIDKPKVPARLPVVLTREEVAGVLSKLRGVHALIGALLYGTGMRVMECLRLRVKDVDFARHEILVRDGKGMKDRVTMLPDAAVPALSKQLAFAQTQHRSDLAAGFGTGCSMRWLGSTPLPRASGIGSMCSRRKPAREILAPAKSAGIICPIR